MIPSLARPSMASASSLPLLAVMDNASFPLHVLRRLADVYMPASMVQISSLLPSTVFQEHAIGQTCAGAAHRISSGSLLTVGLKGSLIGQV